MPNFEDSYSGKLRQAVGDMDIIVPSARAVILDEQKRVLLIKRMDNSGWGLPAGAIELGESIYDCMAREVKEETGLTVISAVPVAIYTDPRFWFKYVKSRINYTFSMSFRVDEWKGELLSSSDETLDARFFNLENLPELVFHYDEVISDALKFNGTFMAK